MENGLLGCSAETLWSAELLMARIWTAVFVVFARLNHLLLNGLSSVACI